MTTAPNPSPRARRSRYHHLPPHRIFNREGKEKGTDKKAKHPNQLTGRHKHDQRLVSCWLLMRGACGGVLSGVLR